MTTIPVGTKLAVHCGREPLPSAFVVIKSGPKVTLVEREVAYSILPNVPFKVMTPRLLDDLASGEAAGGRWYYKPADARLDDLGQIVR